MLKTIYFPREFGMFFSSFESGVWTRTANIWERSVQNNTTLETAHPISLISPSKSSCSSSTSNSDPTSSISMSAKLVLRVEWNETVRTRRVPFDTKKFSNISPEILVEWKAPRVRWGYLASSGLPTRDYPPCPARNSSPNWKRYNRSLSVDQTCSVKMAGYWPL